MIIAREGKTISVPDGILIEPTNLCNSRCVICPIATMTRERGAMEFALFKKVIDELAEVNYPGEITPTLSGEPLLAPNFLEYLRYIRTKVPWATIRVFTNASKLDRATEPILSERLIDVLWISFDGGTRETYQAARSGLSFDNVSSAILNFLSKRREYGTGKPNVRISMVVTEQNRHSRSQLATLFRDADSITFAQYHNYAGQHQKPTLRRRMPAFLTTLNSCTRLNTRLCIQVNGNVCLCCFDYDGKQVIGNVREQSVLAIWNGEKRAQILNNLHQRKFAALPLCAECDIVTLGIIACQTTRLRFLIQHIRRCLIDMLRKCPAIYKSLKEYRATLMIPVRGRSGILENKPKEVRQ